MRVLIIKNSANGIINLKDHEHFVLDNITDFREILGDIVKRQKSQYDYKYCILDDHEFVPFFMKVKNKLFNQMQEFGFERVKFRELSIPEEEKESIIRDMVFEKNRNRIQELERKGVGLLLRKELGADVGDKILNIGEELEILETEIRNINYKDYLDELV